MSGYEALDQFVNTDSLNIDLLEWAIFDETNIQRERLGLLPLKYEYRLQQGARLHSMEMVNLNYFDHFSPVKENETVKKRIRTAGIKKGDSGENIAIHPKQKRLDIIYRLAGTASPTKYVWRNKGRYYSYQEFARELVRRWLNSAPHRANIFSRGFKFTGVGAVPSTYLETAVFYVTQNFSTTNY